MLQSQSENISASAHAGIERRIEPSVPEHARYSTTRKAIVSDKRSTNEDAAVWLDNDGIDIAIRAVAWIETQVDAAVTVEAAQVKPLSQIDLGKLSPNNDATVSLQSEGERSVIEAATNSKILIDASIGVQAANAVVRQPIETGEATGDNYSAIGLQHGGRNLGIGTGAGIKGPVERPIEVETRDAVAGDVVRHRKTASDNNLPVRLRNDHVDGIVSAGSGDKTVVDLARRWSCSARTAAEREQRDEKKATKRRAMHR